jgi:uncharacterized protein YebE (UPF0316 family)
MGLLADSLLTGLPLLPFLVFFAELCVVTLCTLRIIFISRGMKLLAPTLGFFEITIWLFAIGKVMQNLQDIGCFLGFACGFTLGNFFGVLIEKWLALGTVVVRTVTNKDVTDLVAGLQSARYGVTRLEAEGAKGPVKIVFTVVPRRELDAVLLLIRSFDPTAFYSVDEIQEAGSGIFPERRGLRGLLPIALRRNSKPAEVACQG